MRVVTAGGHGQIALLLERMLVDRGDVPVGLVRNPDHVSDLEQVGAEAVVLDLEHASVDEVARALAGADAVVFAAGGGPNSGPERKETVDKGAAILLANAAEMAGVRRYVMVSSMNADNADPDSDEVFQVYLRAKKAADDHLRASDLDWTIVRPGGLTAEAGTERVLAGEKLDRGQIPRADVAATIVATLHTRDAIGKVFELTSGSHTIQDALRSL